jgi:hypothetical protein
MSVLRKCDEPSCRKRYEAKRADSRFCSAACRQRAARKGKDRKPAEVVEIASVREPTVDEILEGDDDQGDGHGPIYTAALEELTAAGRESTTLGQVALKMAWRLDRGRVTDTGSSLASAATSLASLMAQATKGSAAKDDPVDELRRQREARRRGA